MKITQARTRIFRTPADYPLVDDIPLSDVTRDFITLELDTDEGIQGVGMTFVPGAVGSTMTVALRGMVDALCELAQGEDPMRVEQVVGRIRQLAGGSGPEGMFSFSSSYASSGAIGDSPRCSQVTAMGELQWQPPR